MANTQTWDTDFELVPSNGDALSSAPLMFAGMTEGIRERVAHEHEMTVGSNNLIHGRHLEGSFVGFYQSTCPLTHVDGEVLSDQDVGRIWVNSRTSVAAVWAGSGKWSGGWQPISRKFAVRANTGGIQPPSLSVYGSFTENYWMVNYFTPAGLEVGLHPAYGWAAVVPGDAGGWMYAADWQTSQVDLYGVYDDDIGVITIASGGVDRVALAGGIGVGS